MAVSADTVDPVLFSEKPPITSAGALGSSPKIIFGTTTATGIGSLLYCPPGQTVASYDFARSRLPGLVAAPDFTKGQARPGEVYAHVNPDSNRRR